MIVLLLVAAVTALARGHQGPRGAAVVVVSPSGATRTITRALQLVAAGGRIVVRTGLYREPTILVTKPVEILGEGHPVLDGEYARQIMSISAPDVTVHGLAFRNVGVAYTEDMAAIKVIETHGCVIEDNSIDDGFFGIYLQGVTDCIVARNVLRGTHRDETHSGNGIQLWNSTRIRLLDNRISGHRDGIYFEFAHGSTVSGNVSEDNVRYGLHFMYSDDCRYTHNVFRRNGSGVAVMYTKHVTMEDNVFASNWGAASYGLLLKEISDPVIVRNRFLHNTTGLVADGAMRIVARDNRFAENGWAVKLMASTTNGSFTRNDFSGNTFDVSTNSRESENTFSGNYFDAYTGYDLDHDGFGDVAHHPVQLFSVIVEQNSPALILLRSVFVGLIETAERVLPSLTPTALFDPHPAMRPMHAPSPTRVP